MKKTAKALLIGALVGATLSILDGLALGLLFGDVLWWLGFAVLLGGGLGGVAGVAWALLSQRLVLPPPSDSGEK
jgi:hypothetical protein